MLGPLTVPDSNLPAAIMLMGPTASGKTELAMALCRQLPCDIISVDSAQVYRGMDIGSAKPSAELLKQYPHRLVDIRDPADPYSAAQFREDALREMHDITANGRIPLLVGGTMLYFKVLLQGIGDLPSADHDIRAQINAEAKAHGWPHIHQQLAVVDPQSAQRIFPNDPQRLQRALEVYRITGVTLTEWHARQHRRQAESIPFSLYQMAIAPRDRSVLHARIAARFEQMLEQGLLAEVQVLFGRDDMHAGLPAIKAVGYRQVWEYLEGKLSYDEMIERGIIATRQLAKRQYTWLRSWPDLHWIYTDHESCADTSVVYRQKCSEELLVESLDYLEEIRL